MMSFNAKQTQRGYMKSAFSKFLVFVFLFTACNGTPSSSPTLETQAVTSSKKMVLVGGGLKDDNAAIYNKIIELAGGRGVAKIGVITAASLPESQDPDRGTAQASNARANGQFYANLLKNTYGALDAQWIPIDLDTISNNSSQTVVNQINGMTGFFFGGGDQSRLITCFFLANRVQSS
jgi:cyanophycinase